MSLFITSLNSGSNGNCYYIGNENEAVLIDAGISCRETEIRMKRLGLSLEKVKGIFISHEHTDHIYGLRVLSKKYQLPVYITKGTQAFGRSWVQDHLVRRFSPHEEISLGALSITPFPKFHDAGDPHSFVVSHKGTRVGIFTDLGIACKQVIRYFKLCHAAFLESNYDVEMLMNGSYPYYLKKRITEGKGHLSNLQALELFQQHGSIDLTHLILSHLSKNNNSPELVSNLFNPHAKHTEIIVASRETETPVYLIRSASAPVLQPLVKKKTSATAQLSLFS